MNHRISRRTFTGAAAALGLPVLHEGPVASATESGAGLPDACAALSVRPYQLMCVICRVGAGGTDDLGDPRLTAILAAARQDPKRPLSLRCNVDTVYRYQNPGRAEDTDEGELFNAKRDLDILQKLGLVPGDTRPAIDLFERVLAQIPQARGICGYATLTSDTWRGCPQAGQPRQQRADIEVVETFGDNTIAWAPKRLVDYGCVPVPLPAILLPVFS